MRLIDADVFVEDLDTEALNLAMDGLKGTPRPRQHLYEIIDRINEQPTAYDIDKVVEEFDAKIKAIRNTKYIENELQNIAIQTIIINVISDLEQIFKQGGVSDDVCKWKDKELYGYYTSCTEFRSRIACKDTYWKYCPYCGKKIKAVE